MKRLALSLGVAVFVISAMPVLSRAGTLTYTFQTVDFPGDTFTQLLGINNSGTIAGYHGAVINEGFTLTLPNNFVLEDVALSASTQVIGINNNPTPETVGFYITPSGFIYGIATATYQEINDPFAVEPGGTTINGINDKDQIVGFYLDASGNTDGFVGTPTPEPASLLLIGTGLLVITLMVRKRRKGVK
jgi:PEP-CTERM motif